MAERLDFGPGLHRDGRAEDHVRADRRIPANIGVQREEHGFGRGQRHTVFQRVTAGAGLKGRFRLGQLHTGVDAQSLRLGAGDIAYRQTLGAGEFHDICQVIFARRIGIADLGIIVGPKGVEVLSNEDQILGAEV